MRNPSRLTSLCVCLLMFCARTYSQTSPSSYIDPSQLDVPWPKHSFLKQPWRAWLETVPATKLLDGIGINFNSRFNVLLAAKLLGESGFRHARIEIGWGHILFDESGIEKNAAAQFAEKIRACKQNNIRPLILLNAHHGWPCPFRSWQTTVLESAPEGARTVRLANVAQPPPTAPLVPRYTSLFRLGTKDPSHHAEDVFLVDINPASGVCKLSRPLPVALAAGQKVWLRRLKYQPFNEPGTPEFEETADGFLRYARLVCDFVKAQGVEFDVELWNELTFGSDFLTIDRYYDPPIAPKGKDFLRPGGRIWEVARRTIEMIKKEFSGVRCIWGFSNTTFFHTPVKDLPPGTDGQSYHPYGTGYREFPVQEQYRDRPGFNVDGFTPTYRAALAEGWAAAFWQTESLMRLLNPAARRDAPPGVAHFMHYMTEHGVAPKEIGVDTIERAWHVKTKLLLRNVFFWLNKGLDRFYYFCASDKDDLGMNLLPSQMEKKGVTPAESESGRFFSPPLHALRRAIACLQGANGVETPRPLSVSIESVGESKKIFDGDGTPAHPPLFHKDVLAFLPFQIDDRRFAVAIYVMTHDYPNDMPPEEYRLVITGIQSRGAKVECLDPIRETREAVQPDLSEAPTLRLKVAVTDYPRLLIISEGAGE